MDGNIAQDFEPIPTMHGIMEQWRADLRAMDWAHSTKIRVLSIQHNDGEPYITYVDVLEGFEPPRARDGRPRYMSVAKFAESMGWGGPGYINCSFNGRLSRDRYRRNRRR